MTELLTIGETADRLKHSVSWVRRAIRSGRIPVCRPFGGQPRIRASEIEAEIGATSPRREHRKSSASVEHLKQVGGIR